MIIEKFFPTHVYAKDVNLNNQLDEIEMGSAIVVPWTSRHSQLFSALEVERNVMFIILTLIIIVAAFNIISSMIMFVRSKTIDIAVLSAVGASPSTIMKVFFITGAFIFINLERCTHMLNIVRKLLIERIS